ncbi:MAG: hypothetical protein SFX73_16210 [Kofleriaceae bacterium]|nr:hypothetical protein [Kofleriaceae bacterium]
MRWSIASLLLAVVVFGSNDADAQAFKPRGKTPATKPAPAKPAAKKSTAKKSAPKKAAPKKSRLATQARTEDLTPEEEEPKTLAPEEADDYVVIEDDDE